MIHTAEIAVKLTTDEFRLYLMQFKKLFKKFDISRTDTISTYSCKKLNVNAIKFHPQLQHVHVLQSSSYYMIFRLNPQAMLYSDYLSLSNQDDFFNAIIKIDSFFYHNKIFIPPINRFYFRRIDYAFNIYGEPEIVSLYSKILCKGLVRKSYHRVTNYCKKGHRSIPFNSYYATNKSSSVTINFYSKYDELCNKSLQEKSHISQYDLKSAEKIYRFEIQCRSGKLCSLKQSGKITDRSLESLTSENISREIVCGYLSKVIGTGDFYNYKSAKKMIAKSKYRRQTKNNMNLVIEKLSKLKYSAEYDDALYSVLDLQKFNDIGLSPFTLPRRGSIKFLKNPIKLINANSYSSYGNL